MGFQGNGRRDGSVTSEDSGGCSGLDQERSSPALTILAVSESLIGIVGVWMDRVLS